MIDNKIRSALVILQPVLFNNIKELNHNYCTLFVIYII